MESNGLCCKDGSRRQRRVVHTSDLHLTTLKDTACESLEAVVELTAKSQADLVIIAGDLFDHNRVDDNLVSFVAEQLRRLLVPAVLLPGNHDCLIPDSVYNRAGPWKAATNVRVIKEPQGETLTLADLGISIWGKPIMSYEDDFRPLAGVPQCHSKAHWHIAVAHGYYVGSAQSAFESLPITYEDIVASRQDYIALGHWPAFRCVCEEPVKAYYCDSPSWSFPTSTVNIIDLKNDTEVQVSRWSLKEVRGI